MTHITYWQQQVNLFENQIRELKEQRLADFLEKFISKKYLHS